LKKFVKGIFLSLFCLSVVLAAATGAYFTYFESNIKGDYFYKIATDLDEHNPEGSTEALRYYKKAIKSYLGVGNNKNAVEAYINLSLLHYKFGNILQVENNVLKALDLGGGNLPDGTKAKVYLLLASTVEPSRAKGYINDSLKISKAMHLNVLQAEAYFLLGQTYEYKADFENAEQSYLLAIDAVDNFSSIDKFFDAAHLYERLAEIYAGGGQLDKAIKYYYEALAYSMRNERSFITANYMKIIGDLYKEKNDMIKACDLWEQSQDEYAFFGAVAPFTISIDATIDSKPCHSVG